VARRVVPASAAKPSKLPAWRRSAGAASAGRAARGGRGTSGEDQQHEGPDRLCLFDDEKRAGDVLPHLDQKSRESADTFRAINEGSHEALPGPMIDLVKSTEKLARWLVTLQ